MMRFYRKLVTVLNVSCFGRISGEFDRIVVTVSSSQQLLNCGKWDLVESPGSCRFIGIGFGRFASGFDFVN